MKNIENKRIKIDGNRIFLRILRQSDATKEYCGWLNDSRVNLYLATKRATIAGLKKYIRKKIKVLMLYCLGFSLEKIKNT